MFAALHSGEKVQQDPSVKSPWLYTPNEELHHVKTFLIIPSVFINNIQFPTSGVPFCFNKHSFFLCLVFWKDCATVAHYCYLHWSRLNDPGSYIQNQQLASHNLIPTRLTWHLRCVFFRDVGVWMAERVRNSWKKQSLCFRNVYAVDSVVLVSDLRQFFSWQTAN